MTSEERAACPRCGARVQPGQEYCLECGSRLPVPGLAASVGSAWDRRAGRVPTWLWPIVGALLVAAAMTGVAILISQGEDADDGSAFTATGPASVTAPTTETLATEPTTTATTETEPTTARTATVPRPQLVEWPLSQNGYTIVIASLPAAGGRAIALRKAREALRSRLPEVGVLDSGEFSSLHPGYYVVFSGIYDDQRGALAGIGRVRALYPAAYIRQITR